ncbi:MAG: hypothetical protein HC882_00855 [Acidobacteria bacterium]|nr:hypothetical protein [Acidobacteriota bacterium]
MVWSSAWNARDWVLSCSSERDPYCRAVLRRHWPDAQRYDDVRDIDVSAPRVDLLCGGFPCQPVSVAGQRKAQADERWLWPEVARIAAILEPSVLVVENVPGLRTAGLRDVLADLAALGFDAEWTCLAAGENPERRHGWPHVGAPHERRRVFLVATHPDRAELRLEPGWLSRALWEGARESRDACEARALADAHGEGQSQPHWTLGEVRGWASDSGWRHAPSAVRRVDDGSAGGLDAAFADGSGGDRRQARDDTAPDAWRIGALGNAVVPQVAEVVGRAIRGAIHGRA